MGRYDDLLAAVRAGDQDKVGHLYPDKSLDDPLLEDAVRIAIGKNDLPMLEKLYSHSYRQVVSDAAFRTAIFKENLPIIKYLVNSCRANLYEFKHLDVVVTRDALELMQFLLEKGVNISSREGNPIYLAVEKGRVGMIKLLLKHHTNREAVCDVFVEAARKGWKESLEAIIDSRFYDEDANKKAFLAAISNKRLDIVKLLIEKGKTWIHLESSEPMKKALKGGDKALIAYLESAKAKKPSAKEIQADLEAERRYQELYEQEQKVEQFTRYCTNNKAVNGMDLNDRVTPSSRMVMFFFNDPQKTEGECYLYEELLTQFTKKPEFFEGEKPLYILPHSQKLISHTVRDLVINDGVSFINLDSIRQVRITSGKSSFTSDVLSGYACPSAV